MDMIGELVVELQSVGGYVMAAVVVGAFATLALMLWAWRRSGTAGRD